MGTLKARLMTMAAVTSFKGVDEMIKDDTHCGLPRAQGVTETANSRLEEAAILHDHRLIEPHVTAEGVPVRIGGIAAQHDFGGVAGEASEGEDGHARDKKGQDRLQGPGD